MPTLFDAEPVQEAFVATPTLTHAHAQVQENAAAEQRLHLLTRRATHVANHPAALADEDPLLRLGLGPRVRQHGYEPVLAFVDLVDLDLDRVRDLVVSAMQDLLAHDLGKPHLE
jgi:hypothetical protein